MIRTRLKLDFKSCLGLGGIILLTFACYFPALSNGFVNWDDPVYLLENQTIRHLSVENIKQIFTSFVNGNYQPLTVLTFALEYHFFQLHPFIYHLNNVLLHLLNVILVYHLVSKLTQNKFTPFIVSLFFAIHPMHVESVAWVTERKDVLFCFFYLISLILYKEYLVKKDMRWILGTFLFFILSLLSKPAAVSLPMFLLLFDYHHERKFDRYSFFEKVPFFLVSFLFGLIAVYAARILWEDPYPFVHHFTFVERIFLSFYALLQYAWKMFFPWNLSCYYPYPQLENAHLPYSYYLSAIGILALGGIFLFRYKENRVFVFGTLFFLLSIVFNLHFYSVGRVLMADRFTYIPYIGLFFVCAEGFYFYYSKQRFPWIFEKIMMIIMCFIVLTFATLTWNRCKVWRNSIWLWSDVVVKFPDEPMAYYNRVNNFIEWGAIDLAIADYRKGISLMPYPQAYCGLGNMYFFKGLDNLALENYSKAIEMDSKFINAYLNRAEYYRIKGNYEAALKDYDFALELDPTHRGAISRRDMILREKNNQKGLTK